MNVLFIYSLQNTVLLRKPLRGQEEISFGISYIASVLGKEGHKSELLVLNKKNRKRNGKLLHTTIQRFQPGIICFTSVFSEISYVREVAQLVRSSFPDIYLLIGGVHITLNPKEDELKFFDALCIGEGEYPVLELIQALEIKKQPSRISNLWIKASSRIEKNDTRPYIQDLDKLPFPDRSMWQPWILNRDTRLTILLGRGCPFNCTYCCNHKLRKVSGGNYVRLRSPQNIIQEIEMLTAQFPETKEYILEVETLGSDMNWLRNLCVELHNFNKHRETPLSFSSNLRVYPRMDFKNIFSLLQLAGFKSIVIGLESGSERIRKEVLNRIYSNSDVVLAVQAAREHDISVGIFNLVGLPYETPADFEETVKMNCSIQPDWHATSIFFPYPGTELYQRVEEMGLMPSNLSVENERQIARIDFPEFPKRNIQKAFDSFHYEVYNANPDKKIWKSGVYFLQAFIGHNFMAKAKIRVIKTLYLLHLENVAKKMGLFGVFQ